MKITNLAHIILKISIFPDTIIFFEFNHSSKMLNKCELFAWMIFGNQNQKYLMWTIFEQTLNLDT